MTWNPRTSRQGWVTHLCSCGQAVRLYIVPRRFRSDLRVFLESPFKAHNLKREGHHITSRLHYPKLDDPLQAWAEDILEEAGVEP